MNPESLSPRFVFAPEKMVDALEALSLRAPFARRDWDPSALRQIPAAPAAQTRDREFEDWLGSAVHSIRLDVQPEILTYSRLLAFLKDAPPTFFRNSVGETIVFLRLKRGKALLLSPETLRPESVDPIALRHWLSSHLVHWENLGKILSESGIPEKRRARARRGLLAQLFSEAKLPRAWSLRLDPGEHSALRMMASDLHREALLFILSFAGQFGLFALMWWMAGRWAFSGRFDSGWFAGWALILATMVPLQIFNAERMNRLSVGFGVLFRERMLQGALHLDFSDVRGQGLGQLLGRVLESESFDRAIFGGIVWLGTGAFEVLFAVLILSATGSSTLLISFCAWLGIVVALCWYRFVALRRLTSGPRLRLTQDMIEAMVGSRTQKVQRAISDFVDENDRSLAAYHRACASLDRRSVLIEVVLPRGWFILAILAMAPGYASSVYSITQLALGFGGILLANQAIGSITQALLRLSEARIGWRQVQPLLEAARTEALRPHPFGAGAIANRGGANLPATLMEARGLQFRHAGRARSSVRGVSLRIIEGERWIISGASGCGKSTLASLFAGLREPTSGLLTFSGMDRQSIGRDHWRRFVSLAPQFQENHVFSECFAFNLLMGRRWPADSQDLQEATDVCRELGLGALLAKMPAGLFQHLGETGWQLSHGERSRLFLARAILSEAPLVILDESFGPLDPETYLDALECAKKRAPALIVVAHE